MSSSHLRTAQALLLALIMFCGAALAQEAPPPVAPPVTPPATPTEPVPVTPPVVTPVTPPVTTPVTPPVTTPVTTPGTTTPGTTTPAAATQQITINFKDAPIDVVLNYLSDVAGLVILKETAVEGRVTVTSRQPLGVDDAVALINSVLKDRGYAAVRMGRILKIVAFDDAKKRSIPVFCSNDPMTIDPTDQVITQVIPLRYADAVKLKQDLASMVSSSASMASNAAGNSLILTDTGANVRRIVEIIRALDSHMAGVADIRVFQLKYASASSAAKLINDVFKEDPNAQAQANNPYRAYTRFVQTGTGAMGGDDSAQRAPRVTASSDDRTNTVVVTGPSDTLKVVESIIKELDSNPVEDQSIFVYALRNATAKNLETVLNNLFGTTQTGRGTTTTSTGTTTGTRTGTNTPTGNRGPTGTGFPTGTTGTTASAAVQAGASGLYGQVYVVANSDTNSLMVMTSPKNFDRVKAILIELDRAVPQVLIKVLIAEVTHDNSLDLGAEFSVLNLRASGNGSKLFSDFAVAAQTGGLIYKLVENDYSVTLRALEKIGKLDVLSRPYILASDNQAASITVGSTIPLVTDVRTTDTGQSISSFTYKDIGIILKVTPHINPDGLVILDVNPSVTSLTGQTVPVSDTINYPVIANRSATSRVGIRDGQTIVIGGMIQDQKTDTITGIPLLGRIPVLGYLFRRTQTDKSKTELLIFITPQVATQSEVLQAMSEQEAARAKLLPNAVFPGAFEEHMAGMRSDVPPK